jgi:tRNA nucleotidyltransferase (CCA-adding enzyme)
MISSSQNSNSISCSRDNRPSHYHCAYSPTSRNLPITHTGDQRERPYPGTDIGRTLWLAAALTPFRSLTYADSKKKKPSAVEGVIREGLKVISYFFDRWRWSNIRAASFVRLGNLNHFLTTVPALFSAADLLSFTTVSSFVSPAINPSPLTKQRGHIGLPLRNNAVHQPASGTHWSYSTTFALMQELVQLWDAETDTMSCVFSFVSSYSGCLLSSCISSVEATKCLQTYNAFVGRIDELELADSVEAAIRCEQPSGTCYDLC